MPVSTLYSPAEPVSLLLDYISATQAADQVADGIIKWNFSNLQPFEKREITVTLKVNRPTDTPSVNAGDKLYFTASILDNIFTLENTVVGSYDPNDKACLQGERVKPNMVGEYVDYLIRFENTGNYAAENVVVKDIIDTKTFDVSTLKITDASLEVYTRIEGNRVEFIFENIQLPFDDANNDGYIAFKIKTLPSLELIESVSVTHRLQTDTIIFLNTSDIYKGDILNNSQVNVNSLPGQAKKSIQRNDILFSEIRTANGRWANIHFDAEDYVVSTKLMVLRSKGFLSQAFVYFFLTNSQTIDWLQLLAESRSGTFPQITFDQLKDLKINIPS